MSESMSSADADPEGEETIPLELMRRVAEELPQLATFNLEGNSESSSQQLRLLHASLRCCCGAAVDCLSPALFDLDANCQGLT